MIEPERPFVPGDFDADGAVGASDLSVWQEQYGTAVFPGISSDFDRDGDVDGRDFLSWQRNYAAVVIPDATVAYWRHEEGPSGGVVDSSSDAVQDASGAGHHMRTFNSGSTSASYTTSVSPLPLRNGLSNNLALNFGPGGDGGGQNDDNYTDGRPINSQSFAELTVEFAFNMNAIGGFQTLVGKDGKPTSSAVAPLQIKVRGDSFPNGIANQLFVEWIDGDGDVQYLASGVSIASGTWNHVAFVLSATSAELYMVGESGDYSLVDSLQGQDFAGSLGQVLINSTGNFTVGRGMFNNSPADWSNALIDEVRISDQALAASEFLFDPAAAISASLAAQDADDVPAGSFAGFWLPRLDSSPDSTDPGLVEQPGFFTSFAPPEASSPLQIATGVSWNEEAFDGHVARQDSRDLAIELLDAGDELSIFAV
jgi:hypothetical protein